MGLVSRRQTRVVDGRVKSVSRKEKSRFHQLFWLSQGHPSPKGRLTKTCPRHTIPSLKPLEKKKLGEKDVAL